MRESVYNRIPKAIYVIQRVCVRVAQQTLTLYVRVRILHPLPFDFPGIVQIPGIFLILYVSSNRWQIQKWPNRRFRLSTNPSESAAIQRLEVAEIFLANENFTHTPSRRGAGYDSKVLYIVFGCTGQEVCFPPVGTVLTAPAAHYYHKVAGGGRSVLAFFYPSANDNFTLRGGLCQQFPAADILYETAGKPLEKSFVLG